MSKSKVSKSEELKACPSCGKDPAFNGESVWCWRTGDCELRGKVMLFSDWQALDPAEIQARKMVESWDRDNGICLLHDHEMDLILRIASALRD